MVSMQVLDLDDGSNVFSQTRICTDGSNIDHMQNSTTNSTGPLFWITSGKVDAVLNFKFPHNPKNEHLFNLPEVLVDAISTALVLLSLDCIPGQRELAKLPLVAPMGSH